MSKIEHILHKAHKKGIYNETMSLAQEIKVVDPKIAKFVPGGPLSAYETYPSITPLKKGKTTVSFTDGKKTYFLKLTVL
jgi:hypothetical protein